MDCAWMLKFFASIAKRTDTLFYSLAGEQLEEAVMHWRRRTLDSEEKATIDKTCGVK
jgi:hypothetical protein